jgi:hypothetical protein
MAALRAAFSTYGEFEVLLLKARDFAALDQLTDMLSFGIVYRGRVLVITATGY